MPPRAAAEEPGQRLGHEVVIIEVGHKCKRFSVHKKLLQLSAPFFDKGFQEDCFREGFEGVLYLPEDHPGALGLFIKWIHRMTLPSGNSQSYVNALYHLWIFAKKLCLPTSALKDTIIDKIQDVSNNYNLEPSSAMVRMVFDKTAKNSNLRLYCIDVIAFSLLLKPELRRTGPDAKRLEEILDDELEQVYEMTTGHPDMFKDLFYKAIGFMKMNNLSDPRVRYRLGMQGQCGYHEHSEKGDCHFAQGALPPFIRDVE
ncbi:hypothetical protein BKA65DRAFT_545827 [Rhexocercosporidium sp. MPI-PUGE-AT-0058]|nr:hypothetical protein BKA65DRAFT_545827 [Rhexocercosporidium sp. MPI-PUGE-AT-0058]